MYHSLATSEYHADRQAHTTITLVIVTCVGGSKVPRIVVRVQYGQY